MRPAGDPATAAPLIVLFLGVVGEASVGRIAAFMQTSPLSYPPSTTRNMLSGLCKAGQIERCGYGRYRIAPERVS